MNNRLKTVLTVFLGLAMLGSGACATTQIISPSQQALAEQKIHAGNKVTLYYADGESHQVTVTNIDEKEIAGTTKDGTSIAATYGQLESVQHKRGSVLKTAGVALGTVVVGALMVGAAAGELLAAGY
jgi:hypothetical protein